MLWLVEGYIYFKMGDLGWEGGEVRIRIIMFLGLGGFIGRINHNNH